MAAGLAAGAPATMPALSGFRPPAADGFVTCTPPMPPEAFLMIT
eukprot:CAMPEP_0114673804 /NCGR_PEP_ID=MMETSP0191-20121206/45284_1 /TAXON_ID=126664 /ORGANISM="Sorites sp." /LENGTH=43 /DNA_ID= /DNA_START= /DNA_END= /DNA_ORIENTATION=